MRAQGAGRVPPPPTQTSIESLIMSNVRQIQSRKEGPHKKKRKKRKRKHEDYQFKDVTESLAAVPGKLEIHPLKSAPTLEEVKDQLARERDEERMVYFTVPIKKYNTEDDVIRIDSASQQEFTEEDRAELHRYGSRVVINKQGHVVALEVRKDIMKKFKLKHYTADFCKCLDGEYEVSDVLKSDTKARRKFMARVLIVETIIKIPVLICLLLQIFVSSICDLLFKYGPQICPIGAALLSVRVIVLWLSRHADHDHVLKALIVLSSLGFCLLDTGATSIILLYYISSREPLEYEDEDTWYNVTSILGKHEVSFPYGMATFICLRLVMNGTLIAILYTPQLTNIMDEMKNSYLLIIFLCSSLMMAIVWVVVFLSGLVDNPSVWDGMQIFYPAFFVCAWTMWRFYILQELIRGHISNIYEDQYQQAALYFVI